MKKLSSNILIEIGLFKVSKFNFQGASTNDNEETNIDMGEFIDVKTEIIPDKIGQ